MLYHALLEALESTSEAPETRLSSAGADVPGGFQRRTQGSFGRQAAAVLIMPHTCGHTRDDS